MPSRRSRGRVATDLIVEFCVGGVPLSAQSKNRTLLRVWKARVSAAAKLAGKRMQPIEGAIDIHISEFSEGRTRDRDNIAKPIQDAMQGILFENDSQALKLESEWCDIDGRYKVRFISPVLATSLAAGREFVWIRIYRHRPREALIP